MLYKVSLPKYISFLFLALLYQNIISQSITDIELSNLNIDENTTGFLADISSVSGNENSFFSYQLIAGAGDTNNNNFEIITGMGRMDWARGQFHWRPVSISFFFFVLHVPISVLLY